jgi:hypothetical protein
MKSKRSLQKKTQTYMCENGIISITGNKSRNYIKTCDTSDDCSVLNDTKFTINDLTLLSKEIKSQKDYTDIIREIQKHNYCAKLGISKPFIKVVLCKNGETTNLLNNNYEIIEYTLGEITEDTVVLMYTETIQIRPLDLIVKASIFHYGIDNYQTSEKITSAIKAVSNKLKDKGVLHQDLKLEHVGKDKFGDLVMIDFEDVYVEELDKQNNGLIEYSYIFHCVLLAMYAKYLFIVNGMMRIDYDNAEACSLFEHKKIPDFCNSIKDYKNRSVWCIRIIQYYFYAINTFFLQADINISDGDHTLLSSSTPYITDNQQQLAAVLIECFFTNIQSPDYLDPDNDNYSNISDAADTKKGELIRQLKNCVEEILKEKNKQNKNIQHIKDSKKNMLKTSRILAYPVAKGRNPLRAASIARTARLRQESKFSGSNGGSPKTRKNKFRKNKIETQL